LWPTARKLDGEITESLKAWEMRYQKKAMAGINLHRPLTIATQAHSSSPLASHASRPVPPVSAEERAMTAGSGRRLSRWLRPSGPAGACLRTLLESCRWGNPLRSLAWTSAVSGLVEPSAKYLPGFGDSDTSSQRTAGDVHACRLFRLRVLAPSTGETGCGSSAEPWGTPRGAEWKGCGPPGSRSEAYRNERQYLDAQAQMWATATGNDATGSRYAYSRGNHDRPVLKLPGLVNAHSQTGPPPSSNAGPTVKPGQLNPAFVCWLMGYPAGHLDYEGSATPLCRKSRRKSSAQ
jgi:hypothetical protein